MTQITEKVNPTTNFEESASRMCDAIVALANDKDALYNFTSYLTHHFDSWLQKFASTPEGMANEFQFFAEMYQ